MNMNNRCILNAIAAAIRPEPDGLRVNDIPTVVACHIQKDVYGDDLGSPDVVCRLTDGRYVYRTNDRVSLGGLVRVAAYAARWG